MPTSTVSFPGIWGLVLAAGLSRRAAPHNKLLLREPCGRSLVRIAAESFVEAGLEGVVVVTGHQRERIMEDLQGLPLQEVHASGYAGGMGCSLAAGVRALPPSIHGLLVSPADLPGMHASLVRAVAAAFVASGCTVHVVPVCGEERGHPVALGPWLRGGLEQLQGDLGARQLLAAQTERARTRYLDTKDPGAFRDRDLGG
jgi:molybdenum cofactor cytidylyltransferase